VSTVALKQSNALTALESDSAHEAVLALVRADDMVACEGDA
jgi:hypothetical protein